MTIMTMSNPIDFGSSTINLILIVSHHTLETERECNLPMGRC